MRYLYKIIFIILAFSLISGLPKQALQSVHENATYDNSLMIWPAPATEQLNDRYTLKINKQLVPVHNCRVSASPLNQVWPGYQRPLDQTENAGFASWEIGGMVSVEIQSKIPIESVIVRPGSRNIKFQVKGNLILFSLDRSGAVIVEVNDPHHALHLFANPPEKETKIKEEAGVHYFGPGVHHPGKMELKSNETIYIAGGAVVYGSIHATNASHIRIAGRGILDVSLFERDGGGGAIRLSGCSDVKIEGIILRDPDVWCCSIFDCHNITISNIKLIGLWRYNADGIDICNSQDVLVEDCFVRSFDDGLVVKGLKSVADSFQPPQPVRNVRFERCVVWCDWGRAMEIGAETYSPEITGIVFKDCDIIRTTHIAMDIQHGDRAEISSIHFENIRVEIDRWVANPRLQIGLNDKFVEDLKDPYLPTLMVIEIRNNPYSQDNRHGPVHDVVFKDISVNSVRQPNSSFMGFDEDHSVEGVTIANLRFNDSAVHNAIDAGLTIGSYVKNVDFK